MNPSWEGIRPPVFFDFPSILISGSFLRLKAASLMPERPNLLDVAAAAGVSKSTAQRALANDSRCAEKTRSRVRGIAEKMGYVPEPIFAAVGARRRSKATRTMSRSK